MLFICGIVGLFLTLYAIYVEKNANQKKALCDISENVSCTRVLTSPYAKMVGKIFKLKSQHPLNLPNTYYGVLFYLAIMLYPIYPFTLIPFRETLLLTASILSLFSSVVLAYILHFKLKNFCAVCIATYIVNIFIFYYSLSN